MVYDLIETLAEAFSEASSLEELHQSTARLAKEQTKADFGVVAVEENGVVCDIASEPGDWTDTDDLLSPVSLPRIAASQGQSCIVDDKSNVRSAAEDNCKPYGAAVEYPSIIWVPFAENGFLLAGSRSKSAFFDSDLETLRIIRTIAGLAAKRFETDSEHSQHQASIDEAATFLSHDAKNLLNVIHGRLLLAREATDESQLEDVSRNIERLEELIDDTVRLLRTGDHIDEEVPISVEEIASKAWQNIDPAQANLHTHQIGTIVADENRLCQLFENLFRNAVEHVGPNVTIWVGSVQESQGFYVEDDGQGIPPKEQDSVLELGHSTSGSHSGVGLTIVDRIASFHGWEMSVTRGEPGGARFEFRNVEFVEEKSG